MFHPITNGSKKLNRLTGAAKADVTVLYGGSLMKTITGAKQRTSINPTTTAIDAGATGWIAWQRCFAFPKIRLRNSLQTG